MNDENSTIDRPRVRAVDIVLLLDEETEADAVRLNRALLDENDGPVRLASQPNAARFGLPHVSLAMGALDDDAMPDIGFRLAALASRQAPLELEITRLHANVHSDHEVSVLEIPATTRLRDLHETVMTMLASRLTRPVTAAMLVGDDPITPSTVEYIERYAEFAGHENFAAHVTVGHGRLAESIAPRRFTATRLALCHLGASCTCRKIIGEWRLGWSN